MLGTVTLLRRYPVKSMLGEDTGPHAEVTAVGLAGDRGHALIHTSTGRVVSAKNPRLWRAMLTLQASTGTGGAVSVTFPDGTAAASTDPGIDERLSDFLGQPVTLTATPPPDAQMEHASPDDVIRYGVTAQVRTDLVPLGAGTFFNFAALHLITTSTLASADADLVRYRPNIVIGTPDLDGYIENDWLGADLAIGEAVLRVIARTPRCAVPALQHGTAAGVDKAALRVLAGNNRIPAFDGRVPEPCAGVYAQVLRPGRIARDDPVTLARGVYARGMLTSGHQAMMPR
jgi:uncharacterized protein YcbX